MGLLKSLPLIKRSECLLNKENIQYAKRMAWRFHKHHKQATLDQLEQAALLGIWRAACSFSSKTPCKFTTYAWKFIKWSMVRELWELNLVGRAYAEKLYRKSIKIPFSIITTPHNQIFKKTYSLDCSQETIEHYFFYLPSTVKHIATLFWIHGKNKREISRIVNLSVPVVKKRIDLAMTIFKELANDED